MIVVNSLPEFQRALENRAKKIAYEGPDAEKILAEVRKAEAKKVSARRWGWGIAALAVLAAPFTGGVSLFGLGATAGAITISEGVLVALIGLVGTISTAAIRALSDYKIEQERNRLILTHKSC